MSTSTRLRLDLIENDIKWTVSLLRRNRTQRDRKKLRSRLRDLHRDRQATSRALYNETNTYTPQYPTKETK